MTLAALDWTLDAMLSGRAEREIPIVEMLSTPMARSEDRAKSLASRLSGRVPETLAVTVERERGVVGGGSVPSLAIEGFVVALRGVPSAARLQTALRDAATPVIARVRQDALLLDPRCVSEGEIDTLEAGVLECLARLSTEGFD